MGGGRVRCWSWMSRSPISDPLPAAAPWPVVPAPLNIVTEVLHFMLLRIGVDMRQANESSNALSSSDNDEEDEQLRRLYIRLVERHIFNRKASAGIVRLDLRGRGVSDHLVAALSSFSYSLPFLLCTLFFSALSLTRTGL